MVSWESELSIVVILDMNTVVLARGAIAVPGHPDTLDLRASGLSKNGKLIVALNDVEQLLLSYKKA